MASTASRTHSRAPIFPPWRFRAAVASAAAVTRARRFSRSCTTSRRVRGCSSPAPAGVLQGVARGECPPAAGADVIVDDLGFFGEPFFEDGPVALAVRAAVKGGVSDHSSAGNEGLVDLE